MLLMANAESAEDARVAGEGLGRACAAGAGEACDANAAVAARLPRMAPMGRLMRFEACVLGYTDACTTP